MNHNFYMKKCIELAKQAEGQTSPNPLVGCVVLDKNGKEISTGYHKKYGENHAERDALLKLTNGEEEGGTLYVNLEPCCHQGKTPPCTDLIIARKIKKVVIGMRDVNPMVRGKGITQLQDAGIEVTEGVLEDECRKLNEVFIKNFVSNQIFVALKTASTLDGKIATSTGSSKWITSDKARAEVKNIRNRYDAIMTSSSTVLADNPQMSHKKKVILDRKLKTDFENAQIYKSGECFVFSDETLLAESKTKHSDKFLLSLQTSITLLPCPVINDKLDLGYVLNKLYELGIKSVLVESGGRLNGEILKYSDKIYHFIAPKITGDNSSKSCFDYRNISEISECENFRFDSVEVFGPDILVEYYR